LPDDELASAYSLSTALPASSADLVGQRQKIDGLQNCWIRLMRSDARSTTASRWYSTCMGYGFRTRSV